jgi:cell wall assembly regulator SMI1
MAGREGAAGGGEMTSADVPLTEVLAQIDAWYSANVPAIHAKRRPGATDAELDALEQKTKLKLPEAFRTLYKWHDGDGSFTAVFSLGFIPLSTVNHAWNIWQEVAPGTEWMDPDSQSFPVGAIQRRYTTPGWLGFLEDGGGNYVGLDFNPGPAGTPGQVITFGRDEDKKYVLANSLDAFLREYQRRLSRGQVSVAKLDGYSQETLSIQLHDSQGRHTESYFVLADLFPGFGAAPDDRDPARLEFR